MVDREFKNAAFISYSRKDKKVARKLQNWLERFRFARTSDDVVGNRIGRVFRDVTDLSVSSDIEAVLNEEIEQSKKLIVICSPAAAASKWVEQEVNLFAASRGKANILTLLLDGKPNATLASEECLPPSLRISDECQPENRSEPLSADYKFDRPLIAFTRIASGILGLPFDELWQREKKRIRLQRGIFFSACLAFVLLSVLVAVTAQSALQNYIVASQERSNAIASEAIRLAERPNVNFLDSMQLALQADPAANRDWIRARFGDSDRHIKAQLILKKTLLYNRLIGTFRGHSEAINSIVISANQKLLITGSKDQNVILWDLSNGEEIGRLLKHFNSVEAVTTSKQGRYLASGAGGLDASRIRVWDSESYELIAQVKLPGNRVSKLQFCGEELIAASTGSLYPGEGSLNLWETNSFNDIHRIEGAVASFAWLDDCSGVWVVHYDDRVSFWRLDGLELELEIPIKTGIGLGDIAISPDQNSIAVSKGGTISIIDRETRELKYNVETPSDFVSKILYSTDGRLLLAGGDEGILYIYSTDNYTELLGFLAHDSGISDFVLSPDGLSLFTSAEDGSIRSWMLPRFDFMLRRKVDEFRPWIGKKGFSAISKDGLSIAYASKSGEISVLKYRKSSFAKNSERFAIFSNDEHIQSLDFSENGSLLIAGSNKGNFKLLDLNSGQILEPAEREGIELSSIPIVSTDFSPDGSRILVAQGNGILSFWNVQNLSLEKTINLSAPRLNYASYSPDGKRVVAAFGFEGLSVGDFSKVIILGIEEPAFTKEYQLGVSGIIKAYFHPNPELLIIASAEKVIKLNLVAETFETIVEEDGTITDMVFSAEGDIVFISKRINNKGTVGVHDSMTGFELIKLPNFKYPTECVLASDLSGLLVTCEKFGPMEVWKIPVTLKTRSPDDLVEYACNISLDPSSGSSLNKDDFDRFPSLIGEPINPITGLLENLC